MQPAQAAHAPACLAPRCCGEIRRPAEGAAWQPDENPRCCVSALLTAFLSSGRSPLHPPHIQDHAAPDAKIRALNTRDRGICLYYSKRYADAIEELQVGRD